MTKIDNSQILVLSTDPKRQKAINKMLKKWGCVVESVFTPRDLIQLLLRREFDLTIIDASLPAYDSHLMGYAQTIQPWLQWIVLGQPVYQDNRLPALPSAETSFRLEKNIQAKDLRRQVLEAVQLKQQIMQTPARLPLNRILFAANERK